MKLQWPARDTPYPSLTTWWNSTLAHSTVHRRGAWQNSQTCPLLRHVNCSARLTTSSCSRNLSSQYRARNQHSRQCSRHLSTLCQAAQASEDHIAEVFDINSADTNQLQTALNRAIAAEDFALASQVRDQLRSVVGGDTGTADWRQLGIPEWLADRIERMGFKYATGVSIPVLVLPSSDIPGHALDSALAGWQNVWDM